MTAFISVSNSRFFFRRYCALLLALCWLAGIVSGILLAAVADTSIGSLMCRAVYSPVSIVGIFSILLLPFLFSALAVYIFKPWLLYVIAFFKGISVSYVACGMLLAFSSEGWLLCQLLMFSDLVGLPLLFWYWLCHLGRECEYSSARSFFVFSLLFLIGSIDICCVSPFLAKLINS